MQQISQLGIFFPTHGSEGRSSGGDTKYTREIY